MLTATASTCDDAGANTNAGGQCTIVFTSNSAGKVTGHASSTLRLAVGGVHGADRRQSPNSGDAVKTFVDANIQITPNGVNRVGETHTFTAHVNVNWRREWLRECAEWDADQLHEGQWPGCFTSANPCTTAGGTGSCSINLSSAVTGVATVSAHTTLAVGGVSLARNTDGVGANSGPAAKTWVNARISIAPNATNEVGQPHTFTVTLEKDTGTGSFVPAAGEHVDVSLTDSSGAVHSAPTGTCTPPVRTRTRRVSARSRSRRTRREGDRARVVDACRWRVRRRSRCRRTVQSPNSGDAVKTFVDAYITIIAVGGEPDQYDAYVSRRMCS